MSPPSAPARQRSQPATDGATHEASPWPQQSRWGPSTRPHSERAREDTRRYTVPPPPRIQQRTMQRGHGMRHNQGYQGPRHTKSPIPREATWERYNTDVRYARTQTQLSQHSHYGTPRSSYRHGCYNCGEHNHQQKNCRYDHMLRCAICHQLGHKQRLCKYYGQ